MIEDIIILIGFILFFALLLIAGTIGTNVLEQQKCDNYKEAGFETTMKSVFFLNQCWIKDGNVFYPREQIRGGFYE